MGLDSVELVMAVEEKFGISIPDEEASEIRTVGDLHRCVTRKIAIASKSSCLTQRAFHRLRRAAMQLFRTPRSEFRPDTKLASILPGGARRQTWRRLQAAVGATKWPDLKLSWLGVALALALVLVLPWGFFSYSSGVLRWNILVSALAAFGLFIFMARATKTLTRPFQTQFGQGISTVRDLTYYVVAQNPELVGVDRATWTDDESWELLVTVIQDQTGVKEFTKESRIVDDLGID